MTTATTTQAVAVVEKQQGAVTAFDKALEAVKMGAKIPNGLYTVLNKGEKAQVREMRLHCAQAESARFLSGEMVASGWGLEDRQLIGLKSGDKKLTLTVYQRAQKAGKPEVKPDASQLSDDELAAELARRAAAKN